MIVYELNSSEYLSYYLTYSNQEKIITMQTRLISPQSDYRSLASTTAKIFPRQYQPQQKPSPFRTPAPRGCLFSLLRRHRSAAGPMVRPSSVPSSAAAGHANAVQLLLSVDTRTPAAGASDACVRATH